jgi:hypothetical protein
MHNEEIILTKNGGNKMTKSQNKNSLRQYLEDLKAKRNEKPKTIPIKKTKEMKRIEKGLSDLFNNTIGKI